MPPFPPDRTASQAASSLPLQAPTPGDVRAWLERLRPAAIQQLDGLEVIPLTLAPPAGRPIRLASEALADGSLRIHEAGHGHVPEVEAENLTRAPLLLVEGETLLGAKQNRTVVHSIILPGKETTRVPVGCVERGRWAWHGPDDLFRPGVWRVEPDLRRSSLREVTDSRRLTGKPSIDQGRLWNQVESSLRHHRAHSRTLDYHAAFVGARREADRTVRRFVPVKDEVGMIFAITGRLAGIEAACHPETWAVLARRTLPAYVMAGMKRRGERGPEAGPSGDQGVDPWSGARWLEDLARGELHLTQGLGEGADIEITARGLRAAGVWHEGQVAYLSGFGD